MLISVTTIHRLFVILASLHHHEKMRVEEMEECIEANYDTCKQMVDGWEARRVWMLPQWNHQPSTSDTRGHHPPPPLPLHPETFNFIKNEAIVSVEGAVSALSRQLGDHRGHCWEVVPEVGQSSPAAHLNPTIESEKIAKPPKNQH